MLLLAAFAAGQITPEQFLPSGADSPTLKLLAGLASLSTLWAWAVRSDNRVMGTTVPAMAALGLAATVDLNDPVLACFGVFILSVIFLLIHQNYLQNRARAGQAEREAAGPRACWARSSRRRGCAGWPCCWPGWSVIVPAQAVFARLSLAQAIRHLAAIGPHNVGVGGQRGSALLGRRQPAHRHGRRLVGQRGSGHARHALRRSGALLARSDVRPVHGRRLAKLAGEPVPDRRRGQARLRASGTRLAYAVKPDLTPGDPCRMPGPASLTATFRVIGDTSQFYYAAGARQILLDTNVAREGRTPRTCRDGRLDLADHGPVHFPYAVMSSPAPDHDAARSSGPAARGRLRLPGRKFGSCI